MRMSPAVVDPELDSGNFTLAETAAGGHLSFLSEFASLVSKHKHTDI